MCVRVRLSQFSLSQFSLSLFSSSFHPPPPRLIDTTGTVHQAVSSDETHSLHLTFSTYQRHTFYDLVSRMPLLPTDRARLVAMEQKPGWHHTDLPTDALDPLKDSASYSGSARANKAPKWMVKALGNQEHVAAALDVYASEFLVNSLPPAQPSMPCLTADELEQLFAGNEDEDEQEEGPNAEQLLHELTVALRARHCLRMVVSHAGGDEDDGEKGEQQGAVLSTNAANGRAFEASASPQFEVLPALIPAVQRLLQVVPTGLGSGGCAVRLSALVEAVGRKGGEEVNDLLELLLLLTEYGAVDVVQVFGSRSNSRICDGGGGGGGGGSGSGAAMNDSCDEDGGCCDEEGNCSKKDAVGGGSCSSHGGNKKRKRKKNVESGDA